jgi:hypothetical protein
LPRYGGELRPLLLGCNWPKGNLNYFTNSQNTAEK